MSCKEKKSGWVKAFSIIFVVLTAFSFFGVSFYLSRAQIVEELNEDKNGLGEQKNIQKARTGILVDLKLFLFVDLPISIPKSNAYPSKKS